MATISELMEGKKPGEIQICSRTDSERLKFFAPYYWDRSVNYWWGLNEVGRSDCFIGTLDKWEIYTEPKKKVVWYEYAKTKQFESGSSVWLSVNPDLMLRTDDCVYTPTGRTVEVEGE